MGSLSEHPVERDITGPQTFRVVDTRVEHFLGRRMDAFRPDSLPSTTEPRPTPTEDYRPARSFTPVMTVASPAQPLNEQLAGAHTSPTRQGGKGGAAMPSARTLDPQIPARNIFRTVPVVGVGAPMVKPGD